MSREYQTGAINPYALAELVAGKAIKWEKYPDQTQALCEILNISRADLFAADSPILTPYTQILPDGTEKELTYDEAKKRLADFLARRTTRRITKKPPMRKLRLKTIRQRVPEILLFPEPAGTLHTRAPAKDTPWTPTGCAWQDMGEFFKEAPEFDDPMQGALGDCYFIAALSSVAWTRPYAIANHAKVSGQGDESSPLHCVTFYSGGKAKTVEVSEKVAVSAGSSNTTPKKYSWKYARSLDSSRGEIWPAVLEKAYAVWKTGTKTDCPNMDKIRGGRPEKACQELVGGKASLYRHSKTSANNLVEIIRKNCMTKRTVNPMFACTPSSPNAGCDYSSAGIALNHAYSILGWDMSNKQYYVVLRNPWGCGEATINALNGIWRCGSGGNEAVIRYGKNGVFAIPAETFRKYFSDTSVVTDTLVR